MGGKNGVKVYEIVADRNPSERIKIARAREKSWIEEVRQSRFARIENFADAERYAVDFHVSLADVLAKRGIDRRDDGLGDRVRCATQNLDYRIARPDAV